MTTQTEKPLVTDLPRSVREPRVITPTLVVLLGSTPALAALEAMRLMLPMNAEDRRKVAFVFIDTDDVPPPLVTFRNHHAGYFQESKLRIAVPAGIANADRVPQTAIDGMTAAEEPHTFIRRHVPQFFANGAGGIRNNGHVAAAFNYPYVENALEQAIGTISRIGTNQGAKQPVEIQVNIVAFLGGGTGSGILPDIAVTVRQLLLRGPEMQQRINLFCLLPEQIPGVDATDVSWRKSNATATLMEVVALSLAPAARDGMYVKYMRTKGLEVPNTPIAKEVYLIGTSGMNDAGGAARIVGLDLFQRITDASGLGFLEHSQGVDRRTLGTNDERGLPNIFSSSCPVDVGFSTFEMSRAFAKISAARLLPLVAAFNVNDRITVNDSRRRQWEQEWQSVAKPNATAADQWAVKEIQGFGQDAFDGISRGQIDNLWQRVERSEQTFETDVRRQIDRKLAEEMAEIASTPSDVGQGRGLMEQRYQHLLELEQEYETAYRAFHDRPPIVVPKRPSEAEGTLLADVPVWALGPLRRQLEQSRAEAVASAYNDRVRRFMGATRRELLETTLKDLLTMVREQRAIITQWARSAEARNTAATMEDEGRSSLAWQGKLDEPHPHQRHIFDLDSLRAQDGTNVAVEQLYRWATNDKMDALNDKNVPLTYEGFVEPCLRYLSAQSLSGTQAAVNDPIQIGPMRLASRIEDYFFDYYRGRFEDTNLFELLRVAAPRSRSGQSRDAQITDYLAEHLEHIKGVIRRLVAVEPQLSPEGPATLNTSVYLGMHWRDGAQRALLDGALRAVGALTPNNKSAFPSAAIDPHRLQVSFGLHAFSMSMIREFYLDHTSAMSDYLNHQRIWARSGGPPVHGGGELEYLVTSPQALPFRDVRTGEMRYECLPQRIIRQQGQRRDICSELR